MEQQEFDEAAFIEEVDAMLKEEMAKPRISISEMLRGYGCAEPDIERFVEMVNRAIAGARNE